MAQRTVELILQIPFIQTILVKDMQAFEVSDDLGGEDGFEADGTVSSVGIHIYIYI